MFLQGIVDLLFQMSSAQCCLISGGHGEPCVPLWIVLPVLMDSAFTMEFRFLFLYSKKFSHERLFRKKLLWTVIKAMSIGKDFLCSAIQRTGDCQLMLQKTWAVEHDITCSFLLSAQLPIVF